MEEFFKIGDVFYCHFCGEKAKMEKEYYSHGRHVEEYPECNCATSKAYQKMVSDQRARLSAFTKQVDDEIKHFKSVYKTIDANHINRMRYEFEAEKLKKKFNVE